MADFLLGYAPTQNLTLTITSLANGSARASTVVTNSSGYADALVSFRIKTAAASVDTRGSVGIFAYASTNNGGYYTEGATGTDGAITLSSPTNAAKVGYANANVVSTTYDIGPFSVADAFGGVLPQKWGIIFSNSTGAAIDSAVASGWYQPIYHRSQ